MRAHLLVLVLAGGAATARSNQTATAPAADDPALGRAREILKLLTDGRYKEFVAAGTDAVQAGLPADKAQQVWAGLVFQLGAYRGEDSAKLTKVGAHDSVSFVLRFERGTCRLRLVLDPAGKLAGFWCDSVDPSIDYKPPSYVHKDQFREEDVTVSAGQWALPGTLSLPSGAGPHPAVVLVHGSGPHDRDETLGGNQPFRDLAWGLASRGIAVLRYEKRTKAHPLSKPAAEWTLADEVIDDAVAAAALLRQQDGIDPRRVYVLGHSLGGTLAPYIARQDGKLAGIILLAGSPRSILDLVDEQTTYLAGLDGEPTAAERAELEKLREQLAAIRAGRTQDVKEPILGAAATYWEQVHKLDPVGVAAELRVPMLILQGGRDYQVTRRDFEAWQERLGKRDNVKLVLFEDLNHLFVAGEGRSTPVEYQQAGHVDERVIDTLARWIAP